jgi:broad specificity phosphatase PhoE
VRVHFLTHPEVVIDPEVPVSEWGLSDRGRERAQLAGSALRGISAVWSSPEVKAERAARVIADELALPVLLAGGLAEVDRRTTGYLPEPDFWANYQEFLDRPTHSARGWETAVDAQRRIVSAVEEIIEAVEANQDVGADIVLMSHGGVGALLLCQLSGTPIQRLVNQPGQGSLFSFDARTREILHGWQSFEDFARAAAR